jgi:opacity protein-like surface antigen
MKRILMALVSAIALASPAFAGQCPMMMGQIEEALATTAADEATKAQATALLEEGRALHDSGDHAGSEAKLGEAMALLGLTAG